MTKTPIATVQLVRDKLTHLGYTTKERSRRCGHSVTILTDSACKIHRRGIMEKIAEYYCCEIHDTATNRSSIGHVLLDGLRVMVKPNSLQKEGAPGKKNEFTIKEQIEQAIMRYRKIDICFVSDSKVIDLKSISSIKHSDDVITQIDMGTKKRYSSIRGNRADLLLYNKQSSFPISIKQDNAVQWARLECSHGLSFTPILEYFNTQGTVSLNENNGVFRIAPELAMRAGRSIKQFSVFGIDNPVIIKRTFREQDFKLSRPRLFKNAKLTINVSSIIESIDDLSGNNDVYILARNDSMRNALNFKRGLVLSAVTPSRVLNVQGQVRQNVTLVNYIFDV